MPAQSVIVTADDIVAVEVASNRKAAKLGLRLVAPTVLTSPLDPVTVIEALRALGLFPTLDGSSITIDAARHPTGAGTTVDEVGPGWSETDGAGHEASMPADWTGPAIPPGPFPDEISEAVSLLLESTDGSASTPTGVTSPDGQVPGWSDRRLQSFWGRSIAVDALIDGSLQPVTGTVVGLGAMMSLLTVDGIVELPVETVLTVSDPESA
jgi:hypothetical protein